MTGGDSSTSRFARIAQPVAAAERCRAAGRPGLRPGLHRPHGDDPRTPRARAGTTRGSRPGPDPARSGHRGAALRPGDLRGPQGLPGRRRRRHAVPPGRQRARASASPPHRMAMAPLPEEVFIDSVAQLSRIDRDWIPSGEGGSSICGRSCSRARSSSACSRPRNTSSPSSPRRSAPTSRAGVKPVSIWVSPRLHPRRARRHRRRQVRRQLRRLPVARRPRRSSTAATRWSSSMRSSAATSRNSAA